MRIEVAFCGKYSIYITFDWVIYVDSGNWFEIDNVTSIRLAL